MVTNRDIIREERYDLRMYNSEQRSKVTWGEIIKTMYMEEMKGELGTLELNQKVKIAAEDVFRGKASPPH